MKHQTFFTITLSISLLFVSCSSSDDNASEPDGTVTINMLDKDHGKTLLGNSDVYIDEASNFYGPSATLTTLGQKNCLNEKIPHLNNTAGKVAVQDGYAYQIFKNGAVKEFASGELAINILADFYNVYVVSSIIRDDVTVGKSVKYCWMPIPTYDLPEYNTNIGNVSYNKEVSLTLPSSDYELETAFASSNYYTLNYTKEGNKLTVNVVDFKKSDVFGFYIRIKGSYTYVYGKVVDGSNS